MANQQKLKDTYDCYTLVESYLLAYLSRSKQPAPLMVVPGFDEPMSTDQFLDTFGEMVDQISQVEPKLAESIRPYLHGAEGETLKEKLISKAEEERSLRSHHDLRYQNRGLDLIQTVKHVRDTSGEVFGGMIRQDQIKSPAVREQLIQVKTNVNRILVREDQRNLARELSQIQEQGRGHGFFNEYKIEQGAPLQAQCANAIAMVTGEDTLLKQFTAEGARQVLNDRVRRDIAFIKHQMGQDGPTP